MEASPRAHPLRAVRWIAGLALLGAALACADSAPPPPLPPIVVNSLGDSMSPPAGTVTLRSALAAAASGQPIVFDASLDGGTIALSLVADEHTILKGEVMGIRNDPSGPVSYLVGYLDRDYGRSALYARKDVVLDASALPSGITIAWVGVSPDDARVLAVDGDLSLDNVAITGGRSVAVDVSASNPDQPFTLGRGGAVAVWGVARLARCRLYDNHATGDFASSRDRGAFGGAVYADIVEMQDCVVSGNSVVGGGAAGGGVYSVGGAGQSLSTSSVVRSSITGNRISGLFTYGGGVYSDGGGIGNAKTLRITNSTIARNLVEPAPGLPGFLLAAGYWRGGGVYVSNGYLRLHNVTLVENQVHGVPRTDSLSRPNLAGGVAATVGNAHAVEHMFIGHSILAGNTVHEIGGSVYAQDVFTGSLFYFRSLGHNRYGVLDFSQILVPVGQPGWASLSRRHYPQVDDVDGVDVADVLDLSGGITRSATIASVGSDAGELAVLHYAPRAGALDRIPAASYSVAETLAEYSVAAGAADDFLAIFLARVEVLYGLAGFAGAFTADFEAFLQSVDTDPATAGLQPYEDPYGQPILTLADSQWFGPAQTWPRELENHPYIEFWHRLDAALAAEAIAGLGPEGLGDAAWQALFPSSGPLAENPGLEVTISTLARLEVSIQSEDQLGAARPVHGLGDIGAIELR